MTVGKEKPNMGERYWYAIWITFCRYISIMMMLSGVVFILLGHYINNWLYLGLLAWPLFIMWGIVNIRFLRAVARSKRVDYSSYFES